MSNLKQSVYQYCVRYPRGSVGACAEEETRESFKNRIPRTVVEVAIWHRERFFTELLTLPELGIDEENHYLKVAFHSTPLVDPADEPYESFQGRNAIIQIN